MPSRNRDDSKLQNPLNNEERLMMKKLASFAKDEGLLEGRGQ